MITINIRNNFPEVARRLNEVGRQVGDKAMVRALNKTVDQGKTEMARKISQEFNVTRDTAKQRLAVRYASVRGGALRFQALLEATRRGRGRSMNLIHFVEKSVSLAEAKRRRKSGDLAQMRFKVKRTGGNKMIKGAFIGNKGRTLFIRTGKARLPIKALNTIDIGQMFNARRVNDIVKAVMLKRFDANFTRELRSVLRGFAR